MKQLLLIQFLEKLNSENNSIIDNFEFYGVEAKSALQSQALIELKTMYCSQKKCLTCSVGNNLIKST